MTHDHSKQVVVKKFHLQLIWPVLLRGKPEERPGEATPLVNAWADWFVANAGWADPLAGFARDEVTPIPDEYRYEETVYFHPFFRDFLMGDGGTMKRDLSARFLTRGDVRQVRVEIEGLSRDTFDVGRVQLHLLKPCVALLCVEVAAAGLPLWELQRLQDRVRRIYPPYWEAGGVPGLTPQRVAWLGADGSAVCESDVTASRGAFEAFARAGAEPPVCAHWQHFFGPLEPLKTRRQLVDRSLCYQQVTDERIPVMSYFAVPEPRRVTEGDFDRLTFVDDGTDEDEIGSHPYNPEFLRRGRAGHSYERFSHYGTTYLCSSYGFTAVGKSGWFFENVVLTHFRHHYFRMGLVAHYQRAALLYFADELSDAIKSLAGLGPREELNDGNFRQHLEDVQMSFLKFRSRAYFPEATRQLQGQELWELWFRHLNSQKLFDLVDASSERITNVLAQSETRALTGAQLELAQAQGREGEELKQLAREQANLARVAKWGLGASIVLSAASALLAWAGTFPDRIKHDYPGGGESAWGPWFWLGVAAAGGAVAMALTLAMFRRVTDRDLPVASALRREAARRPGELP